MVDINTTEAIQIDVDMSMDQAEVALQPIPSGEMVEAEVVGLTTKAEMLLKAEEGGYERAATPMLRFTFKIVNHPDPVIDGKLVNVDVWRAPDLMRLSKATEGAIRWEGNVLQPSWRDARLNCEVGIRKYTSKQTGEKEEVNFFVLPK